MSGSIPHALEAQRYITDRPTSGAAQSQSIQKDAPDERDAAGIRASSDFLVDISEEAQNLFAQDEHTARAEIEQTDSSQETEEETADDQQDTDDDSDSKEDQNDTQLTEEEQAKVEDLKARDQEVRTHEQAHASTGGQYAGSPSYSYEQGPDGKRYITDGEVQIDVSTIPGDPQATIDKMRQVYRAALAPAEPSGADRSVANEAQQRMSEAMSEVAREAQSATTANPSSNESNKTDTESNASADNNTPNTSTTTPEGSNNRIEGAIKSTLEIASYRSAATPDATGGLINLTA